MKNIKQRSRNIWFIYANFVQIINKYIYARNHDDDDDDDELKRNKNKKVVVSLQPNSTNSVRYTKAGMLE
jgi:hypothetical protein